MRVIWDIETNGLIHDVTRLHCLVIRDIDSGQILYSVRPEDEGFPGAIQCLREASLIVGHNHLNYDLPVMEKLGYFNSLSDIKGKVRDTMLLGRLMFPDIKKQLDFDAHGRLVRRLGTKEHPDAKAYGRIMGSQSLKAWGVRLGIHKADFTKVDSGSEDIWEAWSPEMQSYCERDTEVTLALWRYLSKEAASWYGEDWLDHISVYLVHRAAQVCARMERNGWPFNVQEAQELYGMLVQRRQELTDQLVEAFGTWAVPGEEKTPTRTEPKYHRTKGNPYCKVSFVTFNPKSLAHMANRLINVYGWEPEEFTETGKPVMDEGVLSSLEGRYPEVELLSEFLMVNKRIAALMEGKEGWLKHVRDGKIHCSYMVNGTLSGRASHRNPNLGQVVANDKPYGPECRGLFSAGPWIQVGADMSGLELRCLANRLSPYDGGNYAKVVSQGDVHTTNQKAAGLPDRNSAKTFIYAFLYGAGDRKIGTIIHPDAGERKQVFSGRAVKDKFTKRIPGLTKFLNGTANSLKVSRYLTGLDGRRLYIREKHAAVNTQLQSDGAVLCMAWMCYLDKTLEEMGLTHGWHGDYVFLGWIHDELQMAARTPELAETLGKTAKACAQGVGEFFDFSCPLDGEYKIGKTWKDTH